MDSLMEIITLVTMIQVQALRGTWAEWERRNASEVWEGDEEIPCANDRQAGWVEMAEERVLWEEARTIARLGERCHGQSILQLWCLARWLVCQRRDPMEERYAGSVRRIAEFSSWDQIGKYRPSMIRNRFGHCRTLPLKYRREDQRRWYVREV